MNHLRIKTVLNNECRVYTLYSLFNWVTIVTVNGKTSSSTANSLFEAGHNHLQSCLKVRKLHGEPRDVQSGLQTGDVSESQGSPTKG